MKKITLFLSGLAITTALGLFGCSGGSAEEGSNTQTYSVIDDRSDSENRYHYLVFVASSVEIDRMLTVPGDTYESLSPYFPKVPEISGRVGTWNIVDKVVYLEDTPEIIAEAYYTLVS